MRSAVSAAREMAGRLTDPSQFDLKPTGPGDVLDLGCGQKKFAGSIGVDLSSDTDADVVHDLDIYPWPLEDDAFDQVLAQDVIEHVADPYRFMAEVQRVCRPGATVQLRTPHFSSVLAYSDPTHRHFLSVLGVEALAVPGFEHYTAARFEVIGIHLDMWLPYRALGIEWAANRWTGIYEQYLAFVLTSMNIRAAYRVIK